MTSNHVPASIVRVVRQRARDTCEYCRLPQDSQEATFHVDHVKPRVAGGATSADNLALACVTCSLRKAARQKVRDPRTNRLVRTFNPRKDKWKDHFYWTPTWRIKGTTAVGRATARVLGMNRPAVVSIRQQLVMLGRFPKNEGSDDSN